LNIVFYTKEFDEKITSPVVVILSPQFYWIKKIEIPIKSLFQAKKIAQNLFDLDEEKYKFGAFKAGESYYAYAIDKNLRLKIDKKYIKSIYLAQSELYSYECINVDEKHSIKKINDLLFCFPKEESSECKDVKEVLKEIKLSKNSISLDTVNIEKSTLVLIFLTFLIANVSFFAAGFMYKNYNSELEAQKTGYAEKHGLPSTSYQLNSIYDTLVSLDARQKRIKKDLEYFSSTPLKKGEYYNRLSYASDVYTLDVKTQKNLDNYFKKEFKIISSSYKNKKYTAKLGHE
jgi:hypothetical protein